jgi:hypothetical protein
MRRLGHLFLLALTLNAALLAAALSVPAIAVACSCAAPDPGAPRLNGDEGLVVGVVGAADGRGHYDFTVERSFNTEIGAVAKLGTGRQVFANGTEAFNTCGRDHTPGQHVILVGGVEGDVINSSICSPYETVNSPAGQALLREAIALFGPGVVPGGPIPNAEPGAGNNLATIASVAVLGLLTLIVAGVVIAAVGRQPEPPTT